ncbi:hypothetical protein Syun_020172 [Stephania yunnanensis]|uniref:WW domain-containing protein n=1 Tax=Stephania yunnanensis TaxID=152371 RepID=A0AAP0IDP4_9MAGN
MTAPNMATMTASLERSLQNCSLNGSSNENNGGFGRSASSDDSPHQNLNSSMTSSDDNNSTLELNSESALPYHWEQCLDLKTGEIYYVNWRNGSRTKDDPRKCHSVRFERDSNNQYYFSDEEDGSYDSEGSSSASSPSDLNYKTTTKGEDQVLVVAGCKSCIMYFMLPKRVEECPKCNAFLLHFDGSDHKST